MFGGSARLLRGRSGCVRGQGSRVLTAGYASDPTAALEVHRGGRGEARKEGCSPLCIDCRNSAGVLAMLEASCCCCTLPKRSLVTVVQPGGGRSR